MILLTLLKITANKKNLYLFFIKKTQQKISFFDLYFVTLIHKIKTKHEKIKI